jgi:hypothetical protein
MACWAKQDWEVPMSSALVSLQFKSAGRSGAIEQPPSAAAEPVDAAVTAAGPPQYSERPSERKRASRSLARFLIAFCVGVAGTIYLTTEHSSTIPANRQASAGITPAMIKAGARFLRETYEVGAAAERMAEGVFSEMVSVVPTRSRNR